MTLACSDHGTSRDAGSKTDLSDMPDVLASEESGGGQVNDLGAGGSDNPSDRNTNTDLLDKQTLSNAGQNPTSKPGLTRAGQAFQKHASRPGGDTLWGPLQGGPTALSERGQAILAQIINGEDTQWSVTYKGSRYARYGSNWVLDGILPDGRGARWSPDGTTFIGFINP